MISTGTFGGRWLKNGHLENGETSIIYWNISGRGLHTNSQLLKWVLFGRHSRQSCSKKNAPESGKWMPKLKTESHKSAMGPDGTHVCKYIGGRRWDIPEFIFSRTTVHWETVSQLTIYWTIGNDIINLVASFIKCRK